MNVTAGEVFETSIDWGITGLTGTLRVRLLDGDGGTSIAPTTAGVTEFPAGSERYEVNLTAPATVGQFFVFWDDGAVGDGHSAPGDDILVVGIYIPDAPTGSAYAEVAELFRRLKIREPTADQTEAAEGMLLAATGEIDSEIDLDEDADALAGWQLALAREVCLERAIEYWQESPFGLIVLDAQMGTVGRTARDSWDRYAHKLGPLKGQWGFA